ncbi:MAG: hypothetical protein WD425_13685 [Nitrospirales bacterium]
MRRRPKDEEALKDEQIKKLKQKIGDLVVENDVLREALKPYALGRAMSDGVRAAIRTISKRKAWTLLRALRPHYIDRPKRIHRVYGSLRYKWPAGTEDSGISDLWVSPSVGTLTISPWAPP